MPLCFLGVVRKEWVKGHLAGPTGREAAGAARPGRSNIRGLRSHGYSPAVRGTTVQPWPAYRTAAPTVASKALIDPQESPSSGHCHLVLVWVAFWGN